MISSDNCKLLRELVHIHLWRFIVSLLSSFEDFLGQTWKCSSVSWTQFARTFEIVTSLWAKTTTAVSLSYSVACVTHSTELWLHRQVTGHNQDWTLCRIFITCSYWYWTLHQAESSRSVVLFLSESNSLLHWSSTGLFLFYFISVRRKQGSPINFLPQPPSKAECVTRQ